MKRMTWIVIGWLVLGFTAQAASFDCAKASTRVEHIICDNPEISKLDEELSKKYKAALQDKKQAESVRQAQKQWMKARNECPEARCVKLSYETRLHWLSRRTTDDTLVDSNASGVFTSASIDMKKPGHHFKLVKGSGVAVCDVYKKNLEALGNPNLACERRVSPEYENVIKLPTWRKLDLWENRNLWNQAKEIIHHDPGWVQSKNKTADSQYQIDQLARQYQERAEKYHVEANKIYTADIDVNNDGMSESILREHSGVCGEHVHYKSIALFVLNKKNDAVDIQNSRPLFQDAWFNPASKKLEQSGTVWNGSMYDIFLYEDKTYFDEWSSTGIWVYRISNDETQAICHLN